MLRKILQKMEIGSIDMKPFLLKKRDRLLDGLARDLPLHSVA